MVFAFIHYQGMDWPTPMNSSFPVLMIFLKEYPVSELMLFRQLNEISIAALASTLNLILHSGQGHG
jgi:hypothetical protein